MCNAWLMLVASILLVGCKPSVKSSPTLYEKPTLNCGEHVKREPMGAWTPPPDMTGMTDKQQLDAWSNWELGDAQYIARVAGVFARNTHKDVVTTDCIDKARSDGRIY